MIEDGTYTGVVDAIEDGIARLFLEQDGEEVADTTIAADRLPEEGRHQDAILTVTIADGEVQDMEYDPEATESRKEAAQRRFDRLSERPPAENDEDG